MGPTGKQTPSPSRSSQAQRALDRLLKRIYRTEEFPTISKYLSEINRKLSLNPDTSDATELANIILKDHALTSKLLKMVNSAYYGLAAGKVSTVSRAVVILGYENIRLAILNLTLFDHFKDKSHVAPLKEAVIGSFWSGMMAKGLAAMQGDADPEEAFVCAMMSHLGKLVMIYYLPDEHRKICALMAEKGIGEVKAMRSVCGVTYIDLGVAVAKQWNFPVQIHESMRPLTLFELRNKKKPLPPLRTITSFVGALYDAIHADPRTVDDKRVQSILKRYEPRITVSEKHLMGLLKDSMDNVQRHAQALSLNLAQSVFLDRLSAFSQPEQPESSDGEPSLLPDQTGDSFHLKDENQLSAAARIPATRNPNDIILEGLQEITRIMMHDYDIDTIAVMCLEIFYRALDFHRALMFVRVGESRKMEVRFGYGHDCRQLIRNLSIELGPSKDLFNLSIQVGKDLIVADSYEEKTNHLIPEWYRERINAPSFVFLPINLEKTCIGALYADRDTEGLPISETEHRYLGMLRNQLILSIQHKQAST